MSKKILIELTADEIQQILLVCSDSVAKRLREARDRKRKFSVLEWHRPELVEEDGKQFWIDIPEWERCGASEQVIAITKRGYLSAINVEFVEFDDADGYCLSGVFPDGEDWSEYVEWAYLPEE